MDPLQIGPGDRQAPVPSFWMYREVILYPLTAFIPFVITSSKPSRMHNLPMCIISPGSAGVTTGTDQLPLPSTETWGRCPGMASSDSNADLPVLETRQGSPQSLLADSSHQLLKPKSILHPHLSYTPGLPSAGRICV